MTGGNLGERVRGIEPPLSAWEADVLPLNYTRRRCQSLHEPSRVPGIPPPRKLVIKTANWLRQRPLLRLDHDRRRGT
jgi:hypothetical protein